MGVYLRVFDPKGFRNPYDGSDWRSVGRQKVEPIEAVRPHPMRSELQPLTAEAPPAQTQAPVTPPEPGEVQRKERSKRQRQEVLLNESTIQKAKTPSDLEKEITHEREFYGPGQLTGIAADLMFKNIPTVKSGDGVSEAAKILKSNSFNYLPVLNQKNTICGLITENQIFSGLIEGLLTMEELQKSKVKELMISPVLCCVMETPITTLIQTILEENVGFIPVVDSQDHLQGVVTKRALLSYIFESSHFFDNKPSQ
ncbi:MAG: CBS domain-containing protein [Chlamydiota bacterium]|nr:CBS domain-containing protein [Chlamydiota bacterium]